MEAEPEGEAVSALKLGHELRFTLQLFCLIRRCNNKHVGAGCLCESSCMEASRQNLQAPPTRWQGLESFCSTYLEVRTLKHVLSPGPGEMHDGMPSCPKSTQKTALTANRPPCHHHVEVIDAMKTMMMEQWRSVWRLQRGQELRFHVHALH